MTELNGADDAAPGCMPGWVLTAGPFRRALGFAEGADLSTFRRALGFGEGADKLASCVCARTCAFGGCVCERVGVCMRTACLGMCLGVYV